MRSRRSRILLLLAIAAALLQFLTRTLWLRWTAELLINSEPPRRAQAALVLAGDFSCLRVLKAAELVRDGFVPQVLVSSPGTIYGRPEGELAVGCAVLRDYPASWFQVVDAPARSTVQEANVLRRHLERLGVRDFLVITSDYHTGRAGRAFRSVFGSGWRVTMVSASDEDFSAGSWWTTREGRKKFLYEWMKTVATALGI